MKCMWLRIIYQTNRINHPDVFFFGIETKKNVHKIDKHKSPKMESIFGEALHLRCFFLLQNFFSVTDYLEIVKL